MAEWEPGRWWRVTYADERRYPDGRLQIWSETSVESEARRDLATCPGGGILRRQWVYHDQEWRDA